MSDEIEILERIDDSTLPDVVLPKCDWQYWLIQGNQIVVGHYIRSGYLGHTTVSMSDLPNDFITAADLEALGISLSRSKDGGPVFKLYLACDAGE